MVTECTHGVVQCPHCLSLVNELPGTMKDEFLELIALVAAYYPKSKDAFANLQTRVHEHWNAQEL